MTPVKMAASGGSGTGYTYLATGLPAGIVMDADGTIHGTPTVVGTFPYSVTITDSAGNKSTSNCSVTVTYPPITYNCAVIGAILNTPITPIKIVPGGGSGANYSFSATGLPAGIVMDADGTIHGTPTVVGTFPYSVTITDSAGNKSTSNCSVTVTYPPITYNCAVIGAILNTPITPIKIVPGGGSGANYI